MRFKNEEARIELVARDRGCATVAADTSASVIEGQNILTGGDWLIDNVDRAAGAVRNLLFLQTFSCDNIMAGSMRGRNETFPSSSLNRSIRQP